MLRFYSPTGSGGQVLGTDMYGNTLYANTNGAGIVPAALSSAPPVAASSGPVSVGSWFSQDSLGLGFSNATYFGVALAAFSLFGGGRRR